MLYTHSEVFRNHGENGWKTVVVVEHVLVAQSRVIDGECRPVRDHKNNIIHFYT